MFKRTMLSVAAYATLLAAPFAHATTYYVNNWSLGDGNSGTNTTWPWRTVAKVNSVALVPGDTVLFAAGGTWDETLIARNGVTYGSYNNGNKPIIRGSRAVGDLTWTRTSPTSNIWWATTTAAIETGKISQLYHYTANGVVRLQRARHPNVGTFGANNRYAPVHETAADIETLYLNRDANHLGKFPLGDAGVQGAQAFVRINNSDLNEYNVVGWKPGAQSALKVAGINIIEGWDFWYQVKIPQGWGYWLENKLWMLDSVGEWYFDSQNHKLHVWLPNGASPQGQTLFAASQPAIVTDPNNPSNFTITNIEVRETVGDAISVKGGSNVTLSYLDITRPGSRGIAMTGTTGNSIHHVNVQDSVRNGIWLGDARGGNAAVPAIDTTVSYNTVNNAGKGFRAHGAIMLGDGGVAANNVVTNSSYIGMLAPHSFTIKNNLVKNSCLNFGDCGGIYLGGRETGVPFNALVEKNIVDGGPGSDEGAPASHQYGATDTRGIYLDDFVSGVTVTGNFVTGMRHGFMLHSTTNVTLSQNIAFKNRELQLLMQDGFRRPHDIQTPMGGNVVSDNVFLTVETDYPHVLQQNYNGGSGDNTSMASYSSNRYVVLNSPSQSVVHNYVFQKIVGTDDFQTLVQQNLTFPIWQPTREPLATFRDIDTAYGFYNPANAAATSVSCPSASVPAPCTYVNLKNNTAATFPIPLPANSSVAIGR